MAIAPLDEARDARSEASGLRLVRGGRPAVAAPPGTARHAATARTDALRRSRAAHPTARPVGARPYVTVAAAPREHVAARSTAPRAAMIDAGAVGRARPGVATLARRRRTVGLSVVIVALALLAMPLHALGAVTLDGRSTPGGVAAGLAPGSVYVVQSGDSLASIAQRVNSSLAPAIERQLATSTGSRTVVPGEHVIIP